MLPFPNHSSFLFHPPSSCFDNDLHEVDNTPPLTSVGSNSLPFFSFETPLPPPDPAPAPKDRSDGGGKRRRRGPRNDRHSKIRTAQGLRDRRMRLSIDVANRFFALQDMLGFDKASATVDWLLKQSKSAIEQAAALRADVVPSAVPVNIPGCSSPKSTDSSNSLQTTDQVPLYEKAKELQPSSNFRLAAFKTVSRRESRAEARARARCRTMEKKKKKMMMLLEAGDGGIGQFDSTKHLLFDSTEKVPSLVSSILEYSSCSSLSQGIRRLVDSNIPLCMLGYHQSKDHPWIWDDADIDASYELLPRGMDQ